VLEAIGEKETTWSLSEAHYLRLNDLLTTVAVSVPKFP